MTAAIQSEYTMLNCWIESYTVKCKKYFAYSEKLDSGKLYELINVEVAVFADVMDITANHFEKEEELRMLFDHQLYNSSLHGKE